MNKIEAQRIANEIVDEAVRASDLFSKFHSAHEGWGVIREEYLELEDEIRKHQSAYDYAKIRKEAIQLGAMALRFIYDVVEVEDEQ